MCGLLRAVGIYSSCTTDIGWIAIGFGVSLLVGGVVVAALGLGLNWFIKTRAQGDDPAPKAIIPAWIVGTAERLVFTIGFALFPAPAFATAGGWVILKLRANWMDRDTDNDWVRGRRMRAIILGAVSITFALFGGLLIRCGLGL